MRVFIQIRGLHPTVIQRRKCQRVHLWGKHHKGALLYLVSLVLVMMDEALAPCRRCSGAIRSRLAIAPQVRVERGDVGALWVRGRYFDTLG